MKITVVRIFKSNGQMVSHTASREVPDQPAPNPLLYADAVINEERSVINRLDAEMEARAIAKALFESLP